MALALSTLSLTWSLGACAPQSEESLSAIERSGRSVALGSSEVASADAESAEESRLISYMPEGLRSPGSTGLTIDRSVSEVTRHGEDNGWIVAFDRTEIESIVDRLGSTMHIEDELTFEIHPRLIDPLCTVGCREDSFKAKIPLGDLEKFLENHYNLQGMIHVPDVGSGPSLGTITPVDSAIDLKAGFQHVAVSTNEVAVIGKSRVGNQSIATVMDRSTGVKKTQIVQENPIVGIAKSGTSSYVVAQLPVSSPAASVDQAPEFVSKTTSGTTSVTTSAVQRNTTLNSRFTTQFNQRNAQVPRLQSSGLQLNRIRF